MKQSIKTIFFGTHNFAATILEGLIESPIFSIELVITQPDKPVGRSREQQKSPVKILAEKNNIKVVQPHSSKEYSLEQDLFDIGITAQYGLLIPEHILNAPKKGIINVHTSLLPKYRGASPIQSALINGETETGITIMKMDKGLDTGPIISQKSLAINPYDTYLNLDKKLADIGIQELTEVVPRYIVDELKPVAQDDSLATTCSQFSREHGKINWDKTSIEVYNLYRGLTPWPGIWTTWQGKRFKLVQIKPAEYMYEPGNVMVENGKMYIGCKDKSIEVLSLQLEGKKEMDAKTFLNGFQNIIKARLI